MWILYRGHCFLPLLPSPSGRSAIPSTCLLHQSGPGQLLLIRAGTRMFPVIHSLLSPLSISLRVLERVNLFYLKVCNRAVSPCIYSCGETCGSAGSTNLNSKKKKEGNPYLRTWPLSSRLYVSRYSLLRLGPLTWGLLSPRPRTRHRQFSLPRSGTHSDVIYPTVIIT